MAEDLFAIGGGAWARDDCEAALEGAGGSVEVALELLMGGFTKHAPQAAESESGSGGTGSGTSAGAAGAESRTDGAYSVEDLGGGLWKVVEADRHGQYPFMYVIIAGAAPTRCVVIDTGCGTADYKAFLDAHINVTGLPYFVICTHVHFDHVGGAHSFGADADIAMGGAAQAFTKNYEITSLGAGHGCPVRPFTVSQWLAHGERISLCPASLDGGGSDSRGNESSGASAPISGPAVQDMSAVVLELEVLHIPGHTPDHIALWWEARAVLFVGDHIYPWTAVDVSGLGHSVPDFVASTELLLRTVCAVEATRGAGTVRLACGHVEAEMQPAADALQTMLNVLDGVKTGSMSPSRIEDDDVREYSLGNLSVILLATPKWE